MAGKGFGRCLTESVRLRDIRNLAAPLRSFHREVNSQIVKLDLKPTHLTHHLWGGLRRWPLAGASRGENSISSDSDVSIDFERHHSRRERLGDLPALLERAVVALEDLAGRLDELRYVIASAHHRFRLVTAVEIGCAFDRVSSVRIVTVGSDPYTRTRHPKSLVFRPTGRPISAQNRWNVSVIQRGAQSRSTERTIRFCDLPLFRR